jgi:hypothetical protein
MYLLVELCQVQLSFILNLNLRKLSTFLTSTIYLLCGTALVRNCAFHSRRTRGRGRGRNAGFQLRYKCIAASELWVFTVPILCNNVLSYLLHAQHIAEREITFLTLCAFV